VNEIIQSKSSQAQNLALHRLGGGVSQRIQEIKALLLSLLAAVDIQLDYAEDDVEEVIFPKEGLSSALAGIKGLLDTYRTGRIYQDGVRVVLAGKTNAGKSSLFNLLLKEERSIVSEIHGTTRDYLEAWVNLEGIPLRIYDTAGLREAEDLVEREGIKRTKDILGNSHLILYVVDGSRGLTAEDQKELDLWSSDQKIIKVWNKVDISQVATPLGFLPLSTETGEGFGGLQKAVLDFITQGVRVSEGEVVIDSQRQKNLLTRAQDSLLSVNTSLDQGLSLELVALDLKDAMDALGEITGEVSTADLLNHMFSNFCVGK